MSRPFFDTNILVYGYSAGDPRMARAQELVAQGGVISVQSLNEFANVALRKLAMPWPELREALDVICGLCEPVVPVDMVIHDMGLRIAERYRLSIYDGMIVAAARKATCDIVYSEDLHDGLVVDGVLKVVNPFRA